MLLLKSFIWTVLRGRAPEQPGPVSDVLGALHNGHKAVMFRAVATDLALSGWLIFFAVACVKCSLQEALFRSFTSHKLTE